jgi:flagellar basal body P-ring formation protein FlgA
MRALLFALLLTTSLICQAETPAQNDLAQTVENFLLSQTANQEGQVRVELGKLPVADKYSTCQHWQAFLPPGARPWGRVSVGLRCSEGGSFSFYVGAWVHITGNYLVAAQPITMGRVVQSEDIKTVLGELTTQDPNLLTQTDQVIGLVARTNIPEGRPLQAILFRPENIVQAGQSVNVVAQGNGFAVSNEGQALSGAAKGQSIRVRLLNGKVVSGIVRSKNLVEIRN